MQRPVIIFIKYLSSLWVLSFVILTEKAVRQWNIAIANWCTGSKAEIRAHWSFWFAAGIREFTDMFSYDLTQDVFIAMMQSIGSYTPWRKFDSWLFTIAHNKCMDYFRFRQKIVQAEDTMFDRPDPAASLEDMAAVSLSVKAALEKLPAAQREAVILHYFHQFTAKEIARMTNTPLPTIKSRLRAARNTLSNELREDFP